MVNQPIVGTRRAVSAEKQIPKMWINERADEGVRPYRNGNPRIVGDDAHIVPHK